MLRRKSPDSRDRMAKAPKAGVYKRLARLNDAFDFITEQVAVLGKEGYLNPKMHRLLDAATRQARAEINVQVISNLGDRENKDWSRYERIRETTQKELMEQDVE
jgi:hypothetical protein